MPQCRRQHLPLCRLQRLPLCRLQRLPRPVAPPWRPLRDPFQPLRPSPLPLSPRLQSVNFQRCSTRSVAPSTPPCMGRCRPLGNCRLVVALCCLRLAHGSSPKRADWAKMARQRCSRWAPLRWANFASKSRRRRFSASILALKAPRSTPIRGPTCLRGWRPAAHCSSRGLVPMGWKTEFVQG